MPKKQFSLFLFVWLSFRRGFIHALEQNFFLSLDRNQRIKMAKAKTRKEEFKNEKEREGIPNKDDDNSTEFITAFNKQKKQKNSLISEFSIQASFVVVFGAQK